MSITSYKEKLSPQYFATVGTKRILKPTCACHAYASDTITLTDVHKDISYTHASFGRGLAEYQIVFLRKRLSFL